MKNRMIPWGFGHGSRGGDSDRASAAAGHPCEARSEGDSRSSDCDVDEEDAGRQ